MRKRINFKKIDQFLSRPDEPILPGIRSLSWSCGHYTKKTIQLLNPNLSKEKLESILNLASDWFKRYPALDKQYVLKMICNYIDEECACGKKTSAAPFTTARSQNRLRNLNKELQWFEGQLKPNESLFCCVYGEEPVNVFQAIRLVSGAVVGEVGRKTPQGRPNQIFKNMLILGLWSHLVAVGKVTSDNALIELTDLHTRLTGANTHSDSVMKLLQQRGLRALKVLLNNKKIPK